MKALCRDLQKCEHYLIINWYKEVLCKRDWKELVTSNYNECIEFFK